MTLRLSLEALAVPDRLYPSNLKVEAGEFVGLIGPNGAGKTTLMRAALGLVPATGFSSIAALPITARPRYAAYLAQDREMVWPISVRDLVALGRRAHPDARGDEAEIAERMLSKLDLARFADRPLAQLSGGERARALLARALAQGAPLLLADEPCAALDPAQSIRIAQLLRAEAAAGGASLVILHDLPLAARYCTRLLVMEAGCIVANGPPDEVLTPALCERVFGVTLQRSGEAWFIA